MDTDELHVAIFHLGHHCLCISYKYQKECTGPYGFSQGVCTLFSKTRAHILGLGVFILGPRDQKHIFLPFFLD